MPLEKKSLVDIVIERIKQHIIKENLKPGERYLSEKELIARLEVSRTVVREAIASLQSIGLLKVKRDGIYIDNSNMDAIKSIVKHHYNTHGVEIKEIIEIRKIIELGALRLIIEKDLENGLKKLRDINYVYFDAIENNKDTRKPDLLFHQELIKMTGNKLFYDYSQIISNYFSLSRIDLVKNKQVLLKSFHEHEQIISKIAAKDLYGAHEIMLKHLKPIYQFVENIKDG